MNSASALASAQPGLLGAVLIALACGWLARRILMRGPGVFASLGLGLAGGLAGILATAAIGVPLSGAAGLAGAALGGSIFLLALWVLIARR